MRRLFIPILAICIAGCQAGDTASRITTPGPPAPVLTVGEPGTTDPTDIALIHEGKIVTVGMTPDGAFKVFQDIREGGFESSQAPAGFTDPYRARTWEDGTRGFGVIIYKDRIVMAMYQEENSSVEREKEIVSAHRAQMSEIRPQTIAGERVKYWFWDKDSQRVMICAFLNDKQDLKLTTCMGDDKVLDALGISYDKAVADSAEVDAVFEKPTSVPSGSAK